jgi:hypothetical protein
MIIVVPKVHIDGKGGYQKLPDQMLEKEYLKVLSFVYEPKNGFVAICERLHKKEYQTYPVNEFGDRIGTIKKVVEMPGDIVPLRIEGLRVIKNTGLEDDPERQNYLKELHLFVKGELKENI